MELADLAKLPIIDCHVHFMGEHLDTLDAMLEAETQAGTDRLGLLAFTTIGRPNANALGFYAKYRYPDRIFLFASPDYTALTEDVDHRLTLSLPAEVDRLIALGVDGLKLLDGKPDKRKESKVGLDSPIYDAFFARLAARGLPILWHVNDPEEFWIPRPRRSGPRRRGGCTTRPSPATTRSTRSANGSWRSTPRSRSCSPTSTSSPTSSTAPPPSWIAIPTLTSTSPPASRCFTTLPSARPRRESSS